jgi:hypothetical protein
VIHIKKVVTAIVEQAWRKAAPKRVLALLSHAR